MYDIKFADSARHEEFCGVPNVQILENLKKLAETKTKLLIRIPVIPGINDGMDEMNGIFRFVENFKNIYIQH